MNEATFSRWFLNSCKDLGAFVQRLEVTTGSGVPDAVVLWEGVTIWIEFKWKTIHIRPEQHVWHLKARNVGIHPFVLVGKEDKVELRDSSFAEPMTNTWKAMNLIDEVPRKKEFVQHLLNVMEDYTLSPN